MKNYHKRKKSSSEDLNILYLVNQVISEKNLIRPKERILIAVSGGQDSMCLIKVFFRLKQKWNWKIGIIHCDHQWNSISKLQANHVSQLAHTMELDYYQAITINSIYSEESARKWRYHLIKQIAYSHEYKNILTAHTASDKIETLIYNLFRGSGIAGLQSLSWKRNLFEKPFMNVSFLFKNIKIIFYVNYYQSHKIKKIKHEYMPIIRPLLNLNRLQIRLLLDNWQFPVWLDTTNSSVEISRNRIRHRLIPYIRFYFYPKIDQTISNWAEIIYYENMHLKQLANYIRSKIEIIIIEKKSNIQYIGLPNQILYSLPIFLQRRIIKDFIKKYTNVEICFHQIEHIRLRYLYQINISQYKISNGIKYNLVPFEYMTISLSKEKYIKFTTRFSMIPNYL